MGTKVYGVSGVRDWQCEIPVGRAKAIVHFKGGTETAYGVSPAEYSTDEPVKQMIIENSEYFKHGKIKLLRTSGISSGKRSKKEIKPVASVELKDESLDATKGLVEAQMQSEPETEVEAEMTETEVEAAFVAEDSDFERSEDDSAESVSKTDSEVYEEVTVSCLTEAQNYLRDNFGIATSKSRSKEKAKAFGRENGIVFVGLD